MHVPFSLHLCSFPVPLYCLFFIYEFYLAGECISNDPPVPSEELYRQWAGQYGSVRPLRGLNHRTMLIQVRELCSVQTVGWTVQLCEAPERAQPQDNAHTGEMELYRQWAGQYGSVRPLRGLNHRTMLIQVRELYSVQTVGGTVQLCEAPERAQPQDNAHSG
jgi:hypothetical protein